MSKILEDDFAMEQYKGTYYKTDENLSPEEILKGDIKVSDLDIYDLWLQDMPEQDLGKKKEENTSLGTILNKE